MQSQYLSHIFKFLCTLIAGCLGAYWCYQYSLNAEYSVVNYKQFYETNEDVFPTMSFCLKNPFSREALKRLDINESLYTSFLMGEVFDQKFLNVSFDLVTHDIADFIKGYRVYFKNSTHIKMDSGLSNEERNKLTYSSFNGILGAYPGFYKCFALSIPKIKDLSIFRILLSNKIFPEGKRPTKYDFMTMVHLPKQFLLSYQTVKWIWPYRPKNESYKSRCLIQSVELVRKRDKKEKRCNGQWQDYDDRITRQHIKENKCRNVYQNSNEYEKHTPLCNTQESIHRSKFYMSIDERKEYEPPCKTMEKVTFYWLENVIETEVDDNSEKVGHFWFSIGFDLKDFKEFVHTRYSKMIRCIIV